jgi:regulator of sigma E protease
MYLDTITAALGNASAILLTILFFGGSIFVHEMGHFLAARWRGLIVERFSIGFGPKLLSWKRSGVEYCLSLIPLGGYVALPQIGGMEAIEGTSRSKNKPTKTITYLDKVIVLSMGAIFNVIFALILATVLWFIGVPTLVDEETTIIGYVPKTIPISESHTVAAPAFIAGLKPQDKILAIDGTSVHNFLDIQKLIITGSGRAPDGQPQAVFLIERNHEKHSIIVNPCLIRTDSADVMRYVGLVAKSPIVIGTIEPFSPAADAKLMPEDVLVSIGGVPLLSTPTLIDYLEEHPNETAKLVFERNGQRQFSEITPELVPYTLPLIVLKSDAYPNENLELLPNFTPTDHTLKTTQTAPIASLRIMKLPALYSQGLEVGDQIVALQGTPIESIEHFIATANARPLTEPLGLHVLRGTQTFDLALPANLRAEIEPAKTQPMLGFGRTVSRTLTHPTPFRQVTEAIDTTLRVLKSLLSPSSDVGLHSLMGPPGIVRVLHHFSAEDIRLVLSFTVLLNMNLAILNMLPIPVLDGGHILFATIERIRKRKLPIWLIARLQGLFMAALLAMILYVSFFDVKRWLGDAAFKKRLEVQQDYYIEPTFTNRLVSKANGADLK